MDLVVAVVILLSLLVVIQYNKQKTCFLSQLYCLCQTIHVFESRTAPYSLCCFIGAGGRAGLVFFALPVVDGCGLGGDVCCADCMCIRCAWT